MNSKATIERKKYMNVSPLAPTGWLLLSTVIIVFSIELIITFIGTQGYAAATGGTEVILSLIATLGMTSIVVSARHHSADQSSFDNYR